MLVGGGAQGLQPTWGECGDSVTCCWYEVRQRCIPAEHRPLRGPAGNSDRRSVEGENPLWVVGFYSQPGLAPQRCGEQGLNAG